MKRFVCIFFLLGMLLNSLYCNGETSKTKYLGTWENGKVSYVFTSDSLYISEIGVECFSYTYKCNGGFVYYQSEIDKLDNIYNIIYCRIKDNKLYITIDNDSTYIFNKKINYEKVK